MRKTNTDLIVVFGVCLGLSTATTSLSANDSALPIGQVATLPENIKADLSKSARLLQTCHVQHELAHDYAPSDQAPVRPAGLNCSSVLANGCFFQRCNLAYANSEKTQVMELAFDGKIFYCGSPPRSQRSSSSILTKFLGENSGDDQAATMRTEDNYLQAAGFVLPQTVADWKNSPRLDSFILSVLNEGRILSVIQNDSELLLSLEFPDPVVLSARKLDLDRIANTPGRAGRSTDNGNALAEIYAKTRAREPVRQSKVALDPEKGYAIKSREDRTADGELISITSCEDFEVAHQDGLWLPRTCVTQYFVAAPAMLMGFSSTPTDTVTVNLKEISFQPPEKVSFSLDYGPGCFISDRSIAASQQEPSGAVNYTVPNPKEVLREAAVAAAAKVQPKPGRGQAMLIANGALFLLLAAAVYFSRRARS